jgi:hypothetical protein
MPHMLKNLDFKAVSDFIKTHAEREPKLLAHTDHLLSLLLLASGATLDPSGSVGLGLLAAKGSLTAAGKHLLTWISKRKPATPAERQEQIQVAYALLAYTAFFEALDAVVAKLPKEANPKGEERFILTKKALQNLQRKRGCLPLEGHIPENLHDTKLSLPHPTHQFKHKESDLRPLYVELSDSVLDFLKYLPFWGTFEPKQREAMAAEFLTLPGRALTTFHAQYLALAKEHAEFALWANFEEHDQTRKLIGTVFPELKSIRAAARSLDIGFSSLPNILAKFHAERDRRAAQDVIEALFAQYTKAISQPLFDKQLATDGHPALDFPSAEQIFVPQAFRVLHFTGASGRENLPLEHAETWIGERTPLRNDLIPFLAGFFASPHAAEAPLIILGHPGSGKSLLTQILAVRTAETYTPFRVRLRDLSNADSEIATQIEEQIRLDTKYQENWARLTDALADRPPLVFLDGYDELLQASGAAHRGYLQKAADFQQREATRLPARVVITSRITLIDKAHIPAGATILRLEEFDEQRQKLWSACWNRVNAANFRAAQPSVASFDLPADPKIRPLAGQPLLLLMLAIYDSQSNALRKSRGLDRTRLYDDLLRRFIERECKKDPRHGHRSLADKEAAVEAMMERLGVAAIGMFNRRTLFTRDQSLDADLRWYGAAVATTVANGEPLSAGSLARGSFFFIHKAQATTKEVGATGGAIHDIAFEFLHNTFGEFLAADFLLRRLREQTVAIRELRKSPALGAQLTTFLTGESAATWFATLSYAPLHRRPVILEMAREWLPHALIRDRIGKDEFLRDFDQLLTGHLRRLLCDTGTPPSFFLTRENTERLRADPTPLPIVGHIALYSLNLILLRTAFATDDGYKFEEKDYPLPVDDGTRPWDSLTHLWRAWFSLDNLSDLAAILHAVPSEAAHEPEADPKPRTICLRCSGRLTDPLSSNDRMEVIFGIGRALGDDLLTSLAGIWAIDLVRHGSFDEISPSLERAKLNLNAEMFARSIGDTEVLDDSMHRQADLILASGQVRPETLRIFAMLATVKQDSRLTFSVLRKLSELSIPSSEWYLRDMARLTGKPLLSTGISINRMHSSLRGHEELLHINDLAFSRPPHERIFAENAASVSIALSHEDALSYFNKRVINSKHRKSESAKDLIATCLWILNTGDSTSAESVYDKLRLDALRSEDPSWDTLAQLLNLARHFRDRRFSKDIRDRIFAATQRHFPASAERALASAMRNTYELNEDLGEDLKYTIQERIGRVGCWTDEFYIELLRFFVNEKIDHSLRELFRNGQERDSPRAWFSRTAQARYRSALHVNLGALRLDAVRSVRTAAETVGDKDLLRRLDRLIAGKS